jgi:hypothetical protein
LAKEYAAKQHPGDKGKDEYPLEFRLTSVIAEGQETEDGGWKMEDGGWKTFLVPHSSFLIPLSSVPGL